MGAYLTAEEALAALPLDLRGDFASMEPALQLQALEDASADVDRALGGPRDPATGRALALGTLLTSQVVAVRRAVVEALAFRLADGESVRGASEHLPSGLSLAWRGGRPPSPSTVEALSGHGLIVRSGIAQP